MKNRVIDFKNSRDYPKGCFINTKNSIPSEYRILFNAPPNNTQVGNMRQTFRQNARQSGVGNDVNTTDSFSKELMRVCKIIDRE